MRRLVFVSLILLALAIGAAVTLPKRGDKLDAKSILVGVAQAMEQAVSIHVSGYGTTPDKASPSGMKMMPQRLDIWLSDRAFYLQVVDKEGKLEAATGLEAGSHEWWNYDSDKKLLQLADLTPLGPQADEVIGKIGRLFVDNQIINAFSKFYEDATQTAVMEVRNGKKVAVITIAFTLKKEPERLTERMVFEVDPKTNHILTMRQYAQEQGSPEELVAYLDTFEYDVPLPAGRGALGVPEDLKTEDLTAAIEEKEKSISLVMRDRDREIGRMDVPRE